jgi:hypothetical protein
MRLYILLIVWFICKSGTGSSIRQYGRSEAMKLPPHHKSLEMATAIFAETLENQHSLRQPHEPKEHAVKPSIMESTLVQSTARPAISMWHQHAELLSLDSVETPA